jgi:hypothetical protein
VKKKNGAPEIPVVAEGVPTPTQNLHLTLKLPESTRPGRPELNGVFILHILLVFEQYQTQKQTGIQKFNLITFLLSQITSVFFYYLHFHQKAFKFWKNLNAGHFGLESSVEPFGNHLETTRKHGTPKAEMPSAAVRSNYTAQAFGSWPFLRSDGHFGVTAQPQCGLSVSRAQTRAAGRPLGGREAGSMRGSTSSYTARRAWPLGREAHTPAAGGRASRSSGVQD